MPKNGNWSGGKWIKIPGCSKGPTKLLIEKCIVQDVKSFCSERYYKLASRGFHFFKVATN